MMFFIFIVAVLIPRSLAHQDHGEDCPRPYDRIDFGRNMFGCYYRPPESQVEGKQLRNFCQSLSPSGYPVTINSIAEFEKVEEYLKESKERKRLGNILCETAPRIDRSDYDLLDGTTVSDGFNDGDVVYVEWGYREEYQKNAFGYLFRAESRNHLAKEGENQTTTILNTLLLDFDFNLRLSQSRLKKQDLKKGSFDMKGIQEFNVTLKCEGPNSLRWTLVDRKNQENKQTRVEKIPEPLTCRDITQTGVQKRTGKFECTSLRISQTGASTKSVEEIGGRYEYTYGIKDFREGDSYTFSCKINPDEGEGIYFAVGNGMIRFSAKHGAITVAKLVLYDEAAISGPDLGSEKYETLVEFEPQPWKLKPSTKFNITIECSDRKGLLYRVEDKEQGIVHAFPYLPLQAENCNNLRMMGMNQIYNGHNENPTYHLLREHREKCVAHEVQ